MNSKIYLWMMLSGLVLIMIPSNVLRIVSENSDIYQAIIPFHSAIMLIGIILAVVGGAMYARSKKDGD